MQKSLITSTEVWDHAEYERNILLNKQSWLNLFGEEGLKNDLADSKLRDGQVYETKQQVKDLPRWLKGCIFLLMWGRQSCLCGAPKVVDVWGRQSCILFDFEINIVLQVHVCQGVPFG